MDGGDGPWVGEGVEGLLVVDVVANVEEVPEGEVGAGFEGFGERGGLFGGGFGGGSAGEGEGGGGPGRRNE